jgi:hypothetical protein
MRFDNMDGKRTWMNAKFTNDMYQMAKIFVEINFCRNAIDHTDVTTLMKLTISMKLSIQMNHGNVILAFMMDDIIHVFIQESKFN